MTQLALVILFSLLLTDSYGQNLFPEKFNGCNTDRFSLESDTVTAKVDSQTLITIVTASLGAEEGKNVTGTLALQIIVDKKGQSCLLSIKNDTNLKTKRLRLKENIDSKLQWEEVENKIAAVVVLKFDHGAVSIKRLGVNAKRGVHELRP